MPTIADDPMITRATVTNGVVVRGSRVKHWGQQYTGRSTATVVGFLHDGSSRGEPWVKLILEHDNPESVYAFPTWDWDRTEVTP